MRELSKTSWLALAALCLAACVGAESGHAACRGPRAPYSYPIELRGPAELMGERVSSLVAYARRDGSWRQIALQVDQVNVAGDYVLSGGLPFTKATDDGIFDDNDEVVFSGSELGDEFADADVPMHIRNLGAKHWKASFCRGELTIGSILILRRGKDEVWNTRPAVRFAEGTGTVESDLYIYKFHRTNPVLLGEVLMKGESGARLPVIRESSFLMPLETPFYMPDMTFRDSDFTSSIESWQVGPVRTIVAVGVKYTAFLALFKLHLFSELVFYRDKFEIPTVIEFVFDPTRFLSPGSGIAYSLQFPEGRAWEIESNLAPLPAQDPDDVVQRGPKASAVDVFFARGHRPDGSFLVKVRVDPKARAQVPPPFLLREKDFLNPKLHEHWPWLKSMGEEGGDLGVFLDFSGIREGTYDFGLDLLLSPKAHETFTDYGLVDTLWQRLPPRSPGK